MNEDCLTTKATNEPEASALAVRPAGALINRLL